MITVINLSKEGDWEKIGEYIECKFFVNNVPESPEYQAFVRELTYEEFKFYDIGEAIGGLVKVYGYGWSIYRNRKTKEEYRVVKYFYE